MPRPIPVPDEISKPFWDACNEGRLIIQRCTACTGRRGLNVMQHPPEKACQYCGSDQHLEWHKVSGRGRIEGYIVIYDSRLASWVPEQPYNVAIIEIEENPDIRFFSNLPGTPVDEVPVGASVQVEFQETQTGQKIPEWQVVG